MSRRVVVLGGGFGGIAASTALRRRLPSADEVVLVERRREFVVGFRKTWALLGISELADGTRPVAALRERGVEVVEGTVTRIDPHGRSATVDDRDLRGDALVIALGVELAVDAVPGLREHAINVYDPAEAPGAREAVQTVAATDGARVVVGIFGAPYRCPPAPYELALLLADLAENRGRRMEITVFTPQPMSLPVLGRGGCDLVEGRLAERGIRFLPGHQATEVRPGGVHFGERRLAFDLLLAVPPHRAPLSVRESGLTDGGAWVKVDPRTMETGFPGVCAIGDLTSITLANGMPLPKAGIFAEAQGELVAERIAASLQGQSTDAAFTGDGYCFLEVGGGRAVMVRGGFMADPPQVSITAPSEEQLHAKLAFERERLELWFGG